MNYNPEKHHRRSIRLQGYDYTQEGAYYFTICCHQRRCLLGEIKAGVMHLNLVGATVKSVWENLPRHFPLIALDTFVVMPNHVHGIIVITDALNNCNPDFNSNPNLNCRGEAFVPGCNNTSPESLSTNASPFPGCNNTPPESLSTNASPFPESNDILPPRGTQSGSIGAILQNFKSVATRRVNRITRNSGTLWQRNYHEEIIRNEKAYENIRRYILENPLSWDEDEENPLKFKPIS
ncbi:transposase [Allocoleopsis sp.]|uniref:transposase n=1 Tax=Allocoleopsis sp. TaxID=3088169 RepID=UPI002FD6AABB